MVGCCPVVELRQYTLRPGQRDVLVELFDREFVESQEAVGMELIGQFRDLDRPDRFVWLRGFPDMSIAGGHSRPSTAGPCGRRTARPPTPRWSTSMTCCCCDHRPRRQG
jgi:hypothetical protein